MKQHLSNYDIELNKFEDLDFRKIVQTFEEMAFEFESSF